MSETFLGHIEVVGNTIYFKGKSGRKLYCKLSHLAKKQKISVKRLVVNALKSFIECHREFNR